MLRHVAAAVPESKSGREKTARGLGGAQREFTVTLESVTVEGATGGRVRDAATPVPAVWREPAGDVARGELFAPATLTLTPRSPLFMRSTSAQWVMERS